MTLFFLEENPRKIVCVKWRGKIFMRRGCVCRRWRGRPGRRCSRRSTPGRGTDTAPTPPTTITWTQIKPVKSNPRQFSQILWVPTYGIFFFLYLFSPISIQFVSLIVNYLAPQWTVCPCFFIRDVLTQASVWQDDRPCRCRCKSPPHWNTRQAHASVLRKIEREGNGIVIGALPWEHCVQLQIHKHCVQLQLTLF